MNIVLVGMPGSGKSTVSAELSKVLKRKVIDTDGEIVKNYGEISWIFAELGEKRFRAIETEVIAECSKLNGVIISTGGGSILCEENVQLLKRNGKIVYLYAEVATLLKRAAATPNRPLLKDNPEEKMEKLFKERAALYERAADYKIITDGLTVKQICKRIKELKI